MGPRDLSRNGPDLWRAVLDALNLPGAVVAGGCIRDWYLQLEPKDIDICVPVSSTQEFWEAMKWVPENLFDLHDRMNGSDYEEDDQDLFAVLEGEGLGVPVNIIARKAHVDNQALLDSFDFNVVKACFDSTGCILLDKMASVDLINRTATIAHRRHIELSIERFNRFDARNPGVLALVNPYAEDFLLGK